MSSTRYLHLWPRFGANDQGVSAVEFALVAPVLCVAVLGLVEFGSVVFDRTDMQTANRAGVQYVINGGNNLEQARQIVWDSWTTRPDDGDVTVTQFCLCGEAANMCTEPCADMSIPESYIQIETTGTLGGIVYDQGLTVNDTVRIR